ncbi:BnaC02g09050D [Brassica napus]|uniref:BnaC02g09050D protein n=2 Tax=Brassica TaxID=3705 RepID=A0A078HY78_BRANA|nr:unnamed protein product [Brassica napus]CDY42299.1 BnaC02g09050D [Brassica napus]
MTMFIGFTTVDVFLSPLPMLKIKKDSILVNEKKNAKCIIMNVPVHNVHNIHNQWFSFRCYKQARSRRI